MPNMVWARLQGTEWERGWQLHPGVTWQWPHLWVVYCWGWKRSVYREDFPKCWGGKKLQCVKGEGCKDSRRRPDSEVRPQWRKLVIILVQVYFRSHRSFILWKLSLLSDMARLPLPPLPIKSGLWAWSSFSGVCFVHSGKHFTKDPLASC